MEVQSPWQQSGVKSEPFERPVECGSTWTRMGQSALMGRAQRSTKRIYCGCDIRPAPLLQILQLVTGICPVEKTRGKRRESFCFPNQPEPVCPRGFGGISSEGVKAKLPAQSPEEWLCWTPGMVLKTKCSSLQGDAPNLLENFRPCRVLYLQDNSQPFPGW